MPLALSMVMKSDSLRNSSLAVSEAMTIASMPGMMMPGLWVSSTMAVRAASGACRLAPIMAPMPIRTNNPGIGAAPSSWPTAPTTTAQAGPDEQRRTDHAAGHTKPTDAVVASDLGQHQHQQGADHQLARQRSVQGVVAYAHHLGHQDTDDAHQQTRPAAAATRYARRRPAAAVTCSS